jgi:hypothetical protein
VIEYFFRLAGDPAPQVAGISFRLATLRRQGRARDRGGSRSSGRGDARSVRRDTLWDTGWSQCDWPVRNMDGLIVNFGIAIRVVRTESDMDLPSRGNVGRNNPDLVNDSVPSFGLGADRSAQFVPCI